MSILFLGLLAKQGCQKSQKRVLVKAESYKDGYHSQCLKKSHKDFGFLLFFLYTTLIGLSVGSGQPGYYSSEVVICPSSGRKISNHLITRVVPSRGMENDGFIHLPGDPSIFF